MKPVDPADRVVRNIFTSRFSDTGPDGRTYDGLSQLPLDEARPTWTGFHAMRMAPGAVSPAHEHAADEFFFMVEGELVDHDGTRYGPGDMVWLRAGTQHASHTPNGCTILVYVEHLEKPLE